MAADGWQSIEDVQEEVGVRLGERGDYVAVKAANVGDDLLNGDRPSRRDVEELRETLDEIAQALVTIEELNDAEGETVPLRE
jgi:hypothetical protein